MVWESPKTAQNTPKWFGRAQNGPKRAQKWSGRASKQPPKTVAEMASESPRTVPEMIWVSPETNQKWSAPKPTRNGQPPKRVEMVWRDPKNGLGEPPHQPRNGLEPRHQTGLDKSSQKAFGQNTGQNFRSKLPLKTQVKTVGQNFRSKLRSKLLVKTFVQNSRAQTLYNFYKP